MEFGLKKVYIVLHFYMIINIIQFYFILHTHLYIGRRDVIIMYVCMQCVFVY